jgi:hypothetical protein
MVHLNPEHIESMEDESSNHHAVHLKQRFMGRSIGTESSGIKKLTSCEARWLARRFGDVWGAVLEMNEGDFCGM